MIEKSVFDLSEVPESLLSGLAGRTVALWVRNLPEDGPDPNSVAAFVGLPWRMVVMETYLPEVVQSLEEVRLAQTSLIVRRRGFPVRHRHRPIANSTSPSVPARIPAERERSGTANGRTQERFASPEYSGGSASIRSA